MCGVVVDIMIYDTRTAERKIKGWKWESKVGKEKTQSCDSTRALTDLSSERKTMAKWRLPFLNNLHGAPAVEPSTMHVAICFEIHRNPFFWHFFQNGRWGTSSPTFKFKHTTTYWATAQLTHDASVSTARHRPPPIHLHCEHSHSSPTSLSVSITLPHTQLYPVPHDNSQPSQQRMNLMKPRPSSHVTSSP